MPMQSLTTTIAAAFAYAAMTAETVHGHGAMIFPPPRSSHNQVYDDQNKCGCEDTPGGCYSNASRPGFYCGLGCIGEACLYYQIGCFQGCSTCSYIGKTLYPVPSDLAAAGCAVPPAPTLGGGNATLEKLLRTYNVDNESKLGDWTKWNPWRSPGSAGKGGGQFQPCGVNSGSNDHFPDPPAAGQEKFGNGTDLPPLATPPPTWKIGDVVDIEWSIYANHGGGFSYRLCKKVKGQELTEECYQQTPLEFATDTTLITYYDNRTEPFYIDAVTTDVGTYPPGSQWRKNPIPMCNCDIGTGCGTKSYSHAEEVMFSMISDQLSADTTHVEAKTCNAVIREQCGTKTGTNTCLKCGNQGTYDCEECCPGLEKVTKDGYSYCVASKPGCDPAMNETRGCFSLPYETSNFQPGQTSDICDTGFMFPSNWDDGVGAGIGGQFMFTMTEKIQIPKDIEAGEYSLSWRWDCEQTPQVWNSCADVTISK